MAELQVAVKDLSRARKALSARGFNLREDKSAGKEDGMEMHEIEIPEDKLEQVGALLKEAGLNLEAQELPPLPAPEAPLGAPIGDIPAAPTGGPGVGMGGTLLDSAVGPLEVVMKEVMIGLLDTTGDRDASEKLLANAVQIAQKRLRGAR